MARPALAQKPLPFIHILLVEDDSSDAFLVGSLLDDDPRAGYKTHHVTTQAAALMALAEQTFDVCLLDLALPDASGFSALIVIQEKAPAMPVLILTGTNDTELAKSAVGRGAQDYLLKDELEINGLTRAIDYAMERKYVEKELFQRANHDALTGLVNRDLFQSRLEMAVARAGRSGCGIAILFIDLDRFKPINDAYGHDAGDAVLKTVAQRIKASLRTYDTTARFGGDEFAVLLEGIDTPRDAATIAQKIIKMLSAPMLYHSQPLEIGASIGIAFSKEAETPEILLQNADIAMYHAKKNVGSAYHFYDESMHAEAAARLRLEEDLRTALVAEELRLFYQPCVTLDGETVAGVEALLRWLHPEYGMLSASEFLPTAEGARLMPEIAKWMCSQLRHDIAMWNAYALPPLSIAVNLSVSQLNALDLTQWVAAIAEKELLGGHRLAVEIPEEAVATLSPPCSMMLAKLSKMGIELHLDHFGGGTLSLNALHSLPFSMLKLDKSLIANMSGEASGDILIRAAIMLAHHLGMKAGAVGVETLQQVAALKAQGCDVMQGFLTAEPMTAEQVIEWHKKK